MIRQPVVRRAGVDVHLQIRRPPSTQALGQYNGDAYVFVPDSKTLRDEFSTRGVNINRDLEASSCGLLDVTIETPFGHRLTFGSELEA